MKLSKIWLEAIYNLPSSLHEDLLNEAPHTQIVGAIPSEYSFLNGLVDFGFENIPNSRPIFLAFSGTGVRIPNTNLKLRHVRPFETVFEPSDGSEIELPENWKQAVLVIDGNTPSWVGKLVRPDQTAIDFTIPQPLYQDMGDGWQLVRQLTDGR